MWLDISSGCGRMWPRDVSDDSGCHGTRRDTAWSRYYLDMVFAYGGWKASLAGRIELEADTASHVRGSSGVSSS